MLSKIKLITAVMVWVMIIKFATLTYLQECPKFYNLIILCSVILLFTMYDCESFHSFLCNQDSLPDFYTAHLWPDDHCYNEKLIEYTTVLPTRFYSKTH